MAQIPKLYDGINFTTIPKCILDELKTNSDRRSFISTRDENGKMITKEGDFMRPLFASFYYNALNFYVNEKYLHDLFTWLDLGYCFDAKYNKLNRNNIENFYNEYSKGFNKGYFEFENSLKDKDSIFSTTDVQIAFKIFSQIKQYGFENKSGEFKLVSNNLENKDIEKKICLDNNIKFILLITESNFFESGLNGGKFYKAWELILKNPTVFEPLFLKNSIAKETKPPQQAEASKTVGEIYKTQNLFKLGLLFAKGEMNKYFTVSGKKETLMNNEFSAPKIASDIKEKLKEDISHKYILASINNYTPDNKNGDKNIFNSFDMMTKIISHCEAEKISVDAYFKSRLPIE